MYKAIYPLFFKGRQNNANSVIQYNTQHNAIHNFAIYLDCQIQLYTLKLCLEMIMSCLWQQYRACQSVFLYNLTRTYTYVSKDLRWGGNLKYSPRITYKNVHNIFVLHRSIIFKCWFALVVMTTETSQKLKHISAICPPNLHAWIMTDYKYNSLTITDNKSL